MEKWVKSSIASFARRSDEKMLLGGSTYPNEGRTDLDIERRGIAVDDGSDTRLFDVLSEIGKVGEPGKIPSLLHRIAQRYGVKSIAYLGTGIKGISDREPYLAVTYSHEWVTHYKARQYVKLDPVLQVGMRRLLPFDWQEFGTFEGEVKSFFGEAKEFGLGHQGISIPIRGRSGDRALLSITSDLSAKDWSIARLFFMRDFQVIATHLHDLVLRTEGITPPPLRLSPREQECLFWISEGKTAWECAIILGLSQHTVRFYLESARAKLRAASNTHAVSIAIQAGLLVQPL